MQVAIHHRTAYRYDRLVSLSPQTVRLRPAPHARTRIASYSLRVDPQPHFLNWQQDPFGNWQARVVFPGAVREFVVTVDLVAEPVAFNPFDFFVEDYAERWPFAYERLLSGGDPGGIPLLWVLSSRAAHTRERLRAAGRRPLPGFARRKKRGEKNVDRAHPRVLPHAGVRWS